jgi:hypothetical protein
MNNWFAFRLKGCMMLSFNMVPGVIRPEGRFFLQEQFHLL